MDPNAEFVEVIKFDEKNTSLEDLYPDYLKNPEFFRKYDHLGVYHDFMDHPAYPPPSIEVAKLLNFSQEQIWRIAARIGQLDRIPKHFWRSVYNCEAHISVLRRIQSAYPQWKFDDVCYLHDYRRAKVIIDQHGISTDDAIYIIKWTSDLRLVKYLLHKTRLTEINEHIRCPETFMLLYSRGITLPFGHFEPSYCFNSNIRTISALALPQIIRIIRENYSNRLVSAIYENTDQEDVALYLLEHYSLDRTPYIFKYSIQTVNKYLGRDFEYDDLIQACKYDNLALAKHIKETKGFSFDRADFQSIIEQVNMHELDMLKWLLPFYPEDFKHIWACHKHDRPGIFYILLHHNVENRQSVYEFALDKFIYNHNFNAIMWMYRRFPDMIITQPMFLSLLNVYSACPLLLQYLESSIKHLDTYELMLGFMCALIYDNRDYAHLLPFDNIEQIPQLPYSNDRYMLLKNHETGPFPVELPQEFDESDRMAYSLIYRHFSIRDEHQPNQPRSRRNRRQRRNHRQRRHRRRWHRDVNRA